MLTINANTKIGEILKHHPDALEAIVSISPKFTKLRNSLLRRIMAPRTSINMACKVAGCSVNDFWEKLQPLGFKIDNSIAIDSNMIDNQEVPIEIRQISLEKLVVLDVRPVIQAGQDPLSLILNKLKEVTPGKVLKLINSFEPAPLIQLLSKKGFSYYIENVDDEQVVTYFFKTDTTEVTLKTDVEPSDDWDEKLKQYTDNLETVDVRDLEMPLPMLTILEKLDTLPLKTALYVYHKRVPVFLLPELADRKFSYRIHEITENEVHLLIFRE